MHVDDEDLRKARDWLARHGAGERTPSPLLAARLAVREQAQRRLNVLVSASTFLLVCAVGLNEFVDLSLVIGGEDLLGPLALAAFYLLAAASLWWLSRRQRRQERRIAAELTRRVARSVVRPPGEVLGGWFLAAGAVTYVGGAALGMGMALFSAEFTDRALGGIFAAGTLTLGLVAAVVAGEEVRRPAFAEDDDTLAVDDQLRTEDAHFVVPFAVGVAVVFAGTAESDTASILLLVFAGVSGVLWATTYLRDRRRRLRLPDPAVPR